MAANTYAIGQLVHLTAAFTVSGVATDPTTLALTVRDGAGNVTTPAPVKDSVGNYHLDYSAAVAGTHWYTWAGTGACQAAAQSTFEVSFAHTAPGVG